MVKRMHLLSKKLYDIYIHIYFNIQVLLFPFTSTALSKSLQSALGFKAVIFTYTNKNFEVKIINDFVYKKITLLVREAAKNGIFLSGPATKALPPPLELSGHRHFFPVLKQPKTDFDNKRYFPKFFGLKNPYLDVILDLGNQRYHNPPNPQ